jgi:PilZ domain
MQTTLDPKLEAKQRNRRRSMRRRPRTSVKVQCRKGSHGLGLNIGASVLDLADSGVRLITTQSIEAGSEVEVIITGYGLRHSIKRAGYVRWQLKLEDGNYCTGIEFQKRIDYREWQNLASPN